MITITDESTVTLTSGVDRKPDDVSDGDTSSGDTAPALHYSSESTTTLAPGANPDPDNVPAGDTSSGDSPSGPQSSSESITMTSFYGKALVASSLVKHGQDDMEDASGPFSDTLTWTHRKLRRLLEEAQKKISLPFLDMLETLKKLFGKTKVILVVGQTGTGKTNLLKELTMSEALKPARTMRSGTLEYEIHPHILNGEQFLFIDTAGFGAADIDSEDNLRNIEACITALSPFSILVGVIFVYGRPERLHDHDLKTIRWLECFCGPDFYSNITVVTSRWDEVDEDTFKELWENVPSLEQMTHAILHPHERPGGYLYHHGLELGQGNPDASIAFGRVLKKKHRGEDRSLAILKHVEKHHCDTAPGPIQFLRELKEGKERMDTEAGKALTWSLSDSEVRIEGDRAVVVAKATNSHVDKGDKKNSKSSESTPQTKERCTGNDAKPTQGEAPPVDRAAPPHKKKRYTQASDTEPKPSFAEDVGRWLRFIYEAYTGFSGAKSQSGMGEGPRQSNSPNTTWGSWFMSWFR